MGTVYFGISVMFSIHTLGARKLVDDMGVFSSTPAGLVHRFSITSTLNGGEYRSRFTFSGGLHPGNGFSRVSPRTAPAPGGGGGGGRRPGGVGRRRGMLRGDRTKPRYGLLFWNRCTSIHYR